VPILDKFFASVVINKLKNPQNILVLISMSVNVRGENVATSNLFCKISFPRGKIMIVNVIALIAHINTDLKKMICGFAGSVK
jgi:hypothetical protein